MDSKFGIMMLLFIIPGNLEYLMESASAYGNMGITGVYRDIYIHLFSFQTPININQCFFK